jgi:dihydrofolate reductase
MKVSIVVAVAQNNVIGKDNQLLWHLPNDLKFFKQLTSGHHILMGRKTYQSIGKPLPNRTNMIITADQNFEAPSCLVFTDINKAIEEAMQANEHELFIIGGAQIYKLAMPLVNKIYLTKIDASFDGDTFFPEIKPSEWKQVTNQNFEPDEKNKYHYSFIELERA